MGALFNNSIYRECLRTVFPYINVRDRSFLVTGATGLIGSCIIDVLLLANEELGSNFTIYALGRNSDKLNERFGKDSGVINVVQNIVDPLDKSQNYDYIIQAASNADPVSYALYPVETIITNVYGMKNTLDYCLNNKNTRVLLTSTFEVYGKIDGQSEYRENDYGLINHNELRSGYPESKKTAELLCKSYHDEYGVDCVIGRLCSIYGATMNKEDSKAHAQFIRKALSGENVILKSDGSQRRSYCYVIDAVSGLLKVLFDGASGETYNISNMDSIASIKEVASTVAAICDVEVDYDIPSDIEKKGFSKPQDCILDSSKLEGLGWKGNYSLEEGMKNTIMILKDMMDYS